MTLSDCMQLDKNIPVNPTVASLSVIILPLQFLHASVARIAQAGTCAEIPMLCYAAGQ